MASARAQSTITSITLEMSIEEATTLRALLAGVSCPDLTSVIGDDIFSIYRALGSAGVPNTGMLAQIDL